MTVALSPPSVVNVTLQWFEVYQAGMVGVKRQLAALKDGRPDQHGADSDNGWTLHVEGAAGEMAFAKALGAYWSGSVNTFKDADIGTDIQVRWRSKAYYDLIVRPSDSDDDIFALVLGAIPNLSVVGWIRGADAKQERWLRTYGGRPPAWFVPQDELHSICDLRVMG